MLQIRVSESQYSALLKHISEVEAWGRKLGLTKAAGKDLVIKHTLDSLAALPVLQHFNAQNILDCGSGAGFPGLCLAVCFSQSSFVLAERLQKRAGFLIAASALMGLKNVTVWAQDFNLLPQAFDVCVFRAFTKLNAQTVQPILNKAEILAAYKGRWQEAQKEADDLTAAGCQTQLVKLQPPFQTEERCLLLVSRQPLQTNEL